MITNLILFTFLILLPAFALFIFLNESEKAQDWINKWIFGELKTIQEKRKLITKYQSKGICKKEYLWDSFTTRFLIFAILYFILAYYFKLY
jgi:hypothetical protein